MTKKESNINKIIYQLVAVVILLTIALFAILILTRNRMEPPMPIGEDPGPGIRHVQSLYGPSADDHFEQPESTALDDEGNIYVADTGKHRIVMFNSDGDFVRVFGNEKTIRHPLGVAVSKDKKIYVTSLNDQKLAILDKDGSVVNKITYKEKSDTPIRVTIYNNKLYIAAISRIIVADMKGNTLKKWGVEGVDYGALRYPNGIVIGKVGNLDKGIIVTDTNNVRLQVFSLSGKVRMSLGRPIKGLMDRGTLFGLPSGLALDEEGRILVADAFHHAIKIFDNKGNNLGKVGKQGSADGRYDYPSDIKHIEGNRFIIADKFNNRVQICEITISEPDKQGKKREKQKTWWNPFTWPN